MPILAPQNKPKEVGPEIQEIARIRMRENTERNKLFKRVDDMALNKWEIPTKAKQHNSWLTKLISSDPQDALRAATQILSGVRPRLKYIPLAPEDHNEEVANAIEKHLDWQFQQAERRHSMGLLQDINLSALQYSKIAGQLIFFPHQEKVIGKLTGEKRRKAMRRNGQFQIELRNPKDVYETFSSYGLEDVLYVKVWNAMKFLHEFGPKVESKDRKAIEKRVHTHVLVYDYMDYDRHVIAYQIKDNKVTTSTSAEGKGRVVILMDAENDLGFIPWMIRSRGSSLFDKPEDQLRPLLFGLLTSNHWHNQNILLSVASSEVLVRAASPRRRVRGPNPKSGYRQNFNVPGGIEEVDSVHDVESIPPDPLDPGVMEIIDRVGAMIGKETVAKMIQNPEVRPDVPFSAMNMIFQLGANSLKPFQALSEKWLEDMFVNMLLFVDKFNKDTPLVAFSDTRGSLGEQLPLDATMFDPENLLLNVKLTAEVPTDQVAKANAAQMMNQALKYPVLRGLEDMGIPDPEAAMDEWAKEQMQSADLQLYFASQQQEMAMEAQQMSQMQQQAALEQQQQQEQTPFTQGQAGNPGAGGGQTAAPGIGREQVTGQTKSGDSI